MKTGRKDRRASWLLAIPALIAATSAARAYADEAACAKAITDAGALEDDAAQNPLAFETAARSCLKECEGVAQNPATLKKCREWRDRGNELLAFVRFEVHDETDALVSGGTVAIDSQPPQPVVDAALELNPGPHTFTLAIRLPSGDKTKTVSTGLPSGKVSVVSFSFKTTVDPPPMVEVKKPVWPWVVGGIGLAFAIAGTGTLIAYAHDLPIFNVNCPEGTTKVTCPDEQAQTNAEGYAGGFLVGIGGTAVIIAIVGLATAPKATNTTTKPVASLHFEPLVDPEFAGASLFGTF